MPVADAMSDIPPDVVDVSKKSNPLYSTTY